MRIAGYEGHTELQVADFERNSVPERDDRHSQGGMLEFTHDSGSMIGIVAVFRLVRSIVFFDRRSLLRPGEHLVQTVPAWMDLEGITEENENDNSELPKGDEQGRRGVHSDDVRSDLRGSLVELGEGGKGHPPWSQS